MPALRATLLLIGILATIIGLIWFGQGTGYFPYPTTSTMISQTPCTYFEPSVLVGILIAICAIGAACC